MAINFEAEPFFDDYSEDKQFYRILYRPGYAVQARELTQMQTMIQEQIRRHGDHIFKEGSLVIPGQISYDLDVFFVKLLTPENVNTEATLQNLVGRVLRNDIGVTGKVLTYQRASSESDRYDTLFVKFLSSAQDVDVDDNVYDVKTFRPLENIYPEDGTTGLTVTVAEDDIAENPVSIGLSSTASIQRGVYYIKKNFVLVKEQTIVLDKFSNTPTYRVGLKLTEDIVYPEQDESLLDNSTGSPNYAAPGAARYYMDLTLVKLDPADELDENFIDLLRLENGRVIHKIDRSQYAELEKTLARRTYDESGDYSLAPFNIQVREYRNNNRGEWKPNNIYIQGDIVSRPGIVNARDFFVATTTGQSGGNTTIWNTFNPVTTQFVNDGVGSTQVVWEYITVPYFNRGVYSFASGDARFSNFTINDHIRLDGMLAIGIEKNKAYVRGYEIEKLATEYVSIEKSRDLPVGSTYLSQYLGLGSDSIPATSASVSIEKNVSIDFSMGSYVIAQDVQFMPNIKTFPKVNLHSTNVAGSATNNVIGTARVRAMEFHQTGQYKVFLFDIEMAAGKNFTEVVSIRQDFTNNTFRCNLVLENNKAVLKDPSNISLVRPLPNYAIKNIIEADYFVVASLGPVTIQANVVEFDAPNLHSFASVTNPQNYIFVKNTDGTTPNSAGTIVTPNSLTVVNNKLTATFTGGSGTYSVLATLQVTNQPNFSYRGNLQDDFDDFTTQESVTQKVITLDQSFVVRIVSVLMDPNGFSASPNYTENITNRYIFNDGQTSAAMNRASLELRTGADYPRGSIRVNYEYIRYQEFGTGKSNMINVNSYIYDDSSRIRYDQIPTYDLLALRDCVDFRPFYLNTGGTFREKYLPKYGYNVSLKYTHYLPRLDNLALTSSGRYVASSGIPSLSIAEPNIPDSSMKIATLALEPYTFKTDQRSVRVERNENKRYTMRDIGKLEKRIKDLEYYTSLSLLELDTKNTKIVDSNGLDRLQNGFIVDTFVDQSVGNTSSSEWNASVDKTNAELRPFFHQKQMYLLENVDLPIESRTYKVSGDLVSLPYQEVSLVSQLKASKTENVNPFALYAYRGIMGLNPWSDTWFSTERRPDIIINDEGEYNAIVAKAEADGVLGTAWNAWQDVFSSSRTLGSKLENLGAWSNAQTEILNDSNKGGSFWRARSTFTQDELNLIGVTNGDLWSGQAWAVAGSRVVTVETSAVETKSARSGVRTFVVDKVDSRVLDDRVVETRIVPYIRSRSVLFTAFGLRPSTQLYAFFDGVNVDQYITKALKVKVARIQNNTGGYFPHLFDTTRHCGSAVENAPRLVKNGDLEDVEIAFTHGEIVTEIGGNGHTAIVVGQEVVGLEYFIYLLNVKTSAGNPAAQNPFSLTSGAYLRGEYLTSSGNYPRVKVIQVMPDSYTAGLYSSGTGNAFGIFKIPNGPVDQFRTGTREFKLIDDPSNDDRAARTRASTFYEANGLIEVKQRTILSTRTAELVAEQVSEENTVVTTNERITRDTGWFDPLAQTFLVQKENGAFITSVDIFFQTTDQNVPVRIEIREVVNGYPGSKVLPFSRVEKKGSSITTSTNGSVATNFKFTSPIYLQNGVEYALVILSDSNLYNVFISQTETVDLISGYNISSQPYNGVLFKSQNASTWTADQTQDLKFNIYHAQFDTSQRSIEFITPAIPKKNLAINPLNFKKGSKKIRVNHTNHGMKVDDVVYLASNQVYQGNAIRGIPTSEIFSSSGHEIKSCTLDHYVIEVPTTAATSTGADGGVFVHASEYYLYQTAMLDIAQIEIPGTRIEYSIKTTNEIDDTFDNTGLNVIPKENYTFTEGKTLKDQGSLRVIAKLVSDSPNVSPIIDVGRSAITLISNKVNDPSVLDNDLDLDSETMVGIENEVINVARTSNVGTVTTLSDHSFYVGQKIDLKVDNPAYTAFMNDFVITAIPASNKFSFVSSGPDVAQTNMGGTAIPMSTKIGPGQRFTFDETENSITTTTEYPAEFSKINKLKPGNIIRLDYQSTTISSGDAPLAADNYFVVTSKYLSSVDVLGTTYTTVTISLEPETNGSLLRVTPTGETVDIFWLKNYNSEIGVEIGSVASKYVTKKINLSRPSEMIRVMLAASLPSGTTLQIYYKTGISAATEDFLNSRYIEAKPASGYTVSEDFIDYDIDIEDLLPFDTVIVKLVMRSSNKARVPRIKDLRVIACAA